MDAAVPDRWRRPRYDGAHGITMHAPTGRAKGKAFAIDRNPDFARATHWDEFLRAWRR